MKKETKIGAPLKDDGTRKQQVGLSVEERKVKKLGGKDKVRAIASEAVDKAYELKVAGK